MLIAAITLATVLTGSNAALHHPASIAGVHRAQQSSTGATLALNRPLALTPDPQGNIYVANSAADAIVVYNAAYVQQTNRTIGNINTPTGIAVDPYGNIFGVSSVANQVLEFSPTGVPGTVFSTGLIHPDTVAVDALDDVYVVNNVYSSLSVFQKSGALAHSFRDGQASGSMTAVAINGSTLFTGQSNAQIGNASVGVVQSWDADSLVTSNIAQQPNALLPTNSFVNDMKVDAAGSIWAVDAQTNRILYEALPGTAFQIFKVLNYLPGGIAVDSARGIIYVSDVYHSSIHVYNLKAQHLTTFM